MLEDIRADINRLIALYEGEKGRADALAAKLSESEAAVKSYKEQITDLNGQIDNLRLQYAFTGSGDPVAAKEKLDKLIREIDKCIKLLEK